jgi:hypothetical protein
MFKLDVTNTNKKDKLMAWFSVSSINYIKNLGKTTYNTGYVLDLSFLNIPFVTTSI